MIFVTGPLFSGKQTYIMEALGWDEAQFEANAVRDVQDLAMELAAMAEEGGNVQPKSPSEKLFLPADASADVEKKKDSKRSLSERLSLLADTLAQKEVVIAVEIGGGVVPIDPLERRGREAAGRLACLLADRADKVVRVCCGLPIILKGG